MYIFFTYNWKKPPPPPPPPPIATRSYDELRIRNLHCLAWGRPVLRFYSQPPLQPYDLIPQSRNHSYTYGYIIIVRDVHLSKKDDSSSVSAVCNSQQLTSCFSLPPFLHLCIIMLHGQKKCSIAPPLTLQAAKETKEQESSQRTFGME
jgi:hypothetical protein